MIAAEIEDVGTTPRKPLTKKERTKLFEAHKGICVLCGTKITTPDWIDEHVRALGLAGSNDLSNRGPAHLKCADVKTNGKGGDKSRIAKAKRQKEAAVIGKEAPARKIESPGFVKRLKPKATSRHPDLPRRGLFVTE